MVAESADEGGAILPEDLGPRLGHMLLEMEDWWRREQKRRDSAKVTFMKGK